jgi:hypothetical protein
MHNICFLSVSFSVSVEHLTLSGQRLSDAGRTCRLDQSVTPDAQVTLANAATCW